MVADNTTTEDATTLPSPEQVICILKKDAGAKGIYEIFSLEQTEQDGKPFFELRRSSHAISKEDNSENTKALQDLVDNFYIAGPPAHLQPDPQHCIHVLVSVRSGTGLSLQFYENVVAPILEALGLTASSADGAGQGSYHLVVTQDAHSVKSFSKYLAARGRVETGFEHTVVLLSGDGGVIDILNGYASDIPDPASSASSPPLIAILPLGTGNALFNSLHKKVQTPPASSDLVQGLRTLLRGTAAPLPSFKVAFPPGSRTIEYSEKESPGATDASSNDNKAAEAGLAEKTQYVRHLYGVVVASYGFHSQLVWESDTPEYRQHGAKRFHMVAEQLLKESHAYNATVEITQSPSSSGESVVRKKLDREKHAYILATTVSNLEKTFCISPASEPLDGRLRLVHFGPASGEETMAIMMAAYDGGKHVSMDGVGYEEMDQIRITTHEEDARWRKVCIDGTIVEIPAGGCMVVEKEAKRHLKVLVDGSTV
ncbi:ATP-NAD kinase-like domain-containing protein [Xylaria arbuscula]|nr:ATP-NAD kinase-like domain-containing protein [Xylaria arbuscula]